MCAFLVPFILSFTIYSDRAYLNSVKANVIINYLLLDSIYKTLKTFPKFNNKEFIIPSLANGASEGELTKNFTTCNELDSVIDELSERTSISKTVFLGEKRIYTGFKHSKIEKIKNEEDYIHEGIKEIDEITLEDIIGGSVSLKSILEDPLNYSYYLDVEENDIFPSLNRIIRFIIFNINYNARKDKYKGTAFEHLKYAMGFESIVKKLYQSFIN